jgi:hypothetical protein
MYKLAIYYYDKDRDNFNPQRNFDAIKIQKIRLFDDIGMAGVFFTNDEVVITQHILVWED